MSAFGSMASTLAGRPTWPFDKPTEPQKKNPNKTACMRLYLREHGAATAATLADEAELANVSLVSALLKVDLAGGRVFRRGNKYHWNYQFDISLQKRLSEAAKLLRANGYSVQRGAA